MGSPTDVMLSGGGARSCAAPALSVVPHQKGEKIWSLYLRYLRIQTQTPSFFVCTMINLIAMKFF